jgi:beta-lactamase superfamily II metal-dependent hydrolase
MIPQKRWLVPVLAIFLGASRLVLGDEARGTLDFYWIDSMGGGSTLVVTPAGESVLFDSGNPGGRDSGRILKVAREVAGLKRIDHLVTTHLHSDHFGGAPEIAAEMAIGTVHDNGIPERDPDGRNDATWPQRIRGYREMQVEGRRVVEAGGEIGLKPAREGGAKVTMRFVAARQKMAVGTQAVANVRDCSDPNPKPVDTSDNANSIVTMIEMGGFRFFHGGDLTWNTEAALTCPVDQVGVVDVYQVNHHGLDVSSNPRLLKVLAPTVAVFNNGPTKGCHPTVVEALRSLERRPEIYQVHRNQGASEANTVSGQIANAAAAGGNYLMLTVGPDGKSYEVRVPSTGHSRRFESRRRP